MKANPEFENRPDDLEMTHRYRQYKNKDYRPLVYVETELSKLMQSNNAWLIAFCVGLVTMIIGGVLLALLGFGILHLYRPDFLNLYVNQYAEMWIARIAGLALIGGPICIIPYVVKTVQSKQSIKRATGIQVMKRVEEILSLTELLKAQAKMSPEQKRLLGDVETACLKLIGSIGAVISSDGEENGNPEFDRTTQEKLR